MEAIPVSFWIIFRSGVAASELGNLPRAELICDLEHILSVSRKIQQAVCLYLSEGLARDDVGGYDGILCKRCGRPIYGLIHVQLGLVHYGCLRKSLPYKKSRDAESIALYVYRITPCEVGTVEEEEEGEEEEEPGTVEEEEEEEEEP